MPDGHTTALDANTNTKLMSNSTTATIIDTFHIDNLPIGKTYNVTAEVHKRDKTTKADLGVLKDSSNKSVTKTVTITVANDGKVTAKSGNTNLTVKNTTLTNDVVSTDVLIEITLNSTQLEGIITTVFEEMYYDGQLIFEHKNINDQGQQTDFMKLRTNMSDDNTKDKVAVKKQNDVVVDILTFEDVPLGSKITFNGKLMDKKTQQVMKSNNTDITGSVVLTVTNDGKVSSSSGKASDVDIIGIDLETKTISGTIKLYYTYDSSKFADTTLVSFVTAQTDNGTEVALHEDYNDKLETIYYTSIHTNLNDQNTKTKVAKLGNTTLVDTVTINNLLIDTTYTITGTLHKRDVNGQDLGELTTKTATITVNSNGKVTLNNAENANFTLTDNTISGTLDMVFEVNSSELKGMDLVAFENLYHNGVLIDVHADISDDDQTIHIPNGGTTAMDNITKDKVATVQENGTIKLLDVVHLDNLSPNQKYHLYGILMDKATGESLKINNKEVVVECDFETNAKTITSQNTVENVVYNETTNDISGDITMIFELSSKDLANKDIVVFETGYVTTYNKEVIFEEKDINDLGQTVHFPDVKTLATDDTYKSHVGIVDTQEHITEKTMLYNLVYGMEYEVKATIIDQLTGNPVVDTNNQPITKTIKVTIGNDGKSIVAKDNNTTLVAKIDQNYTNDNTVDATVEIPLVYDSTDYSGKSIVIYEDLMHLTHTVKVHHDINDVGEQIHYYELNLYKTGLTNPTVVEFNLKQNGKLVKFNKISNGEYTISENGTVTKLNPDSKGNINIKGFNGNVYTITEVKTENGKNLLSDPIDIQFMPTEENEVISGMKVTVGGKFIIVSPKNNDKPNSVDLNVTNNDVIKLNTGGNGTMIFYIISLLMLLCASIIIFKKKKIA